MIVQTIQTKMPICVSYLTNTMPIMGGGGGGGGGGASLIFSNANLALKAKFMQIF